MPLLKATFLFNGNSRGWSESYYQTGTGIDDGFRANTLNLMQARLRLMSQQYSIFGIRMSRPDVFRDSLFLSGNAAPLNGLEPFWDLQPTEIDAALLFRMEGGLLHRRALLLRGCPEKIVGTFNQYVPNPVGLPWQSQVTIWRKALTGVNFLGLNAGQWQLFGLDTPTCPLVNITVPQVQANPHGLSFQSANAITRILPAVPPAPATTVFATTGTPITIKGVRNSHGVNGRWVIQAVAPAPGPGVAGPFTYTCYPAIHLIATPADFNPGQARYLAYDGDDITTVQDEQMANKKTGRPFGIARGRQPRRA